MRSLLFSIAFVACSSQVTPTSPPDVFGLWRGQIDVFTIQFNVGRDGNYFTKVDSRADSAAHSLELGTWQISNHSLVITPFFCTRDGIQYPCSGVDSIPINITGNTWPMRFSSDNQSQVLTMERN